MRTAHGGSQKKCLEAKRCDRPGAAGAFPEKESCSDSLVSSPGSGKTTFLEKTLTLLRPHYRVAALVGDLATENDARELARSGAPVKQITTGTLCHLGSGMIQNALDGWDVASWIFCLLKMWAIWCVRRLTIWEKICGLCFFRLPKEKTSR